MLDGASMVVPKRFTLLRLLTVVFKVLAWIGLVVSLVAAIAVALLGGAILGNLRDAGLAQTLPLFGGGGAALAIMALIWGVLNFLLLYAVAEGISLQLAVEENTRLTAALLLKLDQESQSEPSIYQRNY